MVDTAYRGVDAHLNSLLQTPGVPEQPALWPSFHGEYITHIADALNAQLPRGYLAMKQLIEPLEKPRAVMIRELLPQRRLGRIVAQIELLSPSNKPGGAGYETYSVKRANAIADGLPLIEIDYLHESPPILPALPAYPDQPGAFPYSVLVSDPRPDWRGGRARAYGFVVDEVITIFPVPLLGDETLIFDLNPVYQHTFHAGRWADICDYAGPPERFGRYRSADQARIEAVMARVNHRTDESE
jgi:hypothetical protein